jgi:hypothetical protein
MPKSRRPCPEEYRQQIIELVRAGRTPESLAREFEPTAQCIRNWVSLPETPSAPLRSLRDPPIKAFGHAGSRVRRRELASPRTAAVPSGRTTGEYVPVWQRRGAMVRRRAVRNGAASRRRVALE